MMTKLVESPAGTPEFHDLVLDGAMVGLSTVAKTVQLDARRVLGFAAGVLESGDAYCNDERQGGLIIHPGIAFCLQFESQERIWRPPASPSPSNPNIWLGAVHAETNLEIHAPFELDQVITTQGRVIARRQTRAGVLNVERYRMVDAFGQLLAEMDFNLMFRGARLAGPDVAIEALPHPLKPSFPAQPQTISEVFIRRDLLHHYTACSGIYAPIHTERRVARAAGFQDIILQGSALKSIALSKVVERFFAGDARAVRRLSGRLRAPVLADTTITIDALGVEDDAEGLTNVFFRVLNQAGDEAISDGLVRGRVARAA